MNLLEKIEILSRDDEFAKSFFLRVKEIRHDVIALDNGAEAMLIRPGKLDGNKKHPMLAILHGGPFGATFYNMFTPLNNFFLLQDFCLLVINYRGSTGYGEKFLKTLLGNIGINDVEDCGRLT